MRTNETKSCFLRVHCGLGQWVHVCQQGTDPGDTVLDTLSTLGDGLLALCMLMVALCWVMVWIWHKTDRPPALVA